MVVGSCGESVVNLKLKDYVLTVCDVGRNTGCYDMVTLFNYFINATTIKQT